MHNSSLLCKTSFCFCLILTFPTTILYSSWTALLYPARFHFDVAWCWHCLQGYFIPSRTALLRWSRFPFLLIDADIPHKETLFLHELLVCVLQDVLLMLLDDGIAHKNTLFLHEKLFCDLQDYLLMLLDADIANKDTFFHELLFCVLQDVLLMLLDADISHKDTLFLHEQLFCVSQDLLSMLIDTNIDN